MEKHNPASLAVIIPHLNSPGGLSRCLASLDAERRNADQDFQVIVVDNGSINRPVEICAAYPFVTLLDETEPGPGPARNLGARMSESDILAFIDADCTACPGWISKILTYFRDHPETAVIGGEVRIDYVDPEKPTAIEAYESVYAYRMRLYYEREHYTGTGNMAVRREAFRQVGEFAGIDVAEDQDWGRRATALGLRIDFVPEMAIMTPARTDFAELARKWDRQISHQFKDVRGFFGRLRWALKALALVVSPIAEVPVVLRSDKLSRPLERWLAFGVLTQIRFYRCRRMLSVLVGAGPSSLTAWRVR